MKMSPMYATAVMLLMAAEGSMAIDELMAEDIAGVKDVEDVEIKEAGRGEETGE
ncbi:MAG: hypothetical protein P8J87_00355 [Verrucomicrobiales bacterium]|nr:hypothetical protein [Verrucomicrobiales bacterium]